MSSIQFINNTVTNIIGSACSKAAGYLNSANPFQIAIFGSNTYGQLGLNDTVHRSFVQYLTNDVGWKSASCGSEFTLMIDSAQYLWSTGRNNVGQLGIGIGLPDKSSPVQIGFLANWNTVAAGSETALALNNAGYLYGWGSNSFGAIGISTSNAAYYEPTLIDDSYEWKFISGGLYHNAAIRTDDTLWLWGKNSNGQLGDSTTEHRSSPVQVAGSWKWVCAGYENTIAIDLDGYLWSWGVNNVGQLGDQSTVNRSSPVKIGSENKWAQAFITDICASAQDIYGYQWVWGSNDHGGLGQFTPNTYSSPIQMTSTNAYNQWYTPVGVRKGGFFGIYSYVYPVASPTTTPTPTTTASPTPSPSPSPSDTPTPSPSESPTPTPSFSPSPTPSPSPSPSPTPLPSPTPPFDMRVWGLNYDGELGNNTNQPIPTPFDIGFNP